MNLTVEELITEYESFTDSNVKEYQPEWWAQFCDWARRGAAATTDENRVLTHLDGHIRSWRENHNHSVKRIRLRAIDAADALQQLRLQTIGALLPQDNGTFKVYDLHGEGEPITVTTHEEARAAYGKCDDYVLPYPGACSEHS